MEIIINTPENVKILETSLEALATKQRFMNEVRIMRKVPRKVVEIVLPPVQFGNNSPLIITENELSEES